MYHQLDPLDKQFLQTGPSSHQLSNKDPLYIDIQQEYDMVHDNCDPKQRQFDRMVHIYDLFDRCKDR